MRHRNQQNRAYLTQLKQKTERTQHELEQALAQTNVSMKLAAYTKWIHAVLKYRQEYQVLNGNWPKDDIVPILKRAETVACFDIWGTAQSLPEPPKLDWSSNSTPHSELNKFYRWGVKAKQLKLSIGSLIIHKIWGSIKSAPRWIYVLVIFLAALLTVFYYLGWLEPIKAFIKNILWLK
jgi:hypothetical protein